MSLELCSGDLQGQSKRLSSRQMQMNTNTEEPRRNGSFDMGTPQSLEEPRRSGSLDIGTPQSLEEPRRNDAFHIETPQSLEETRRNGLFDIENPQSLEEPGRNGSFDIENPQSLEVPRRNESESSARLPSRSIYKVPKRLRLVNETAYTPNIVAIGPIHHGREHLQDMEKHKEKYLDDLLRMTNVRMESYWEVVRQNEKKLRACYDEPSELDSDEFVKIILVDAAFIIALLIKSRFETVEVEEEGRIIQKPLVEEEDRIFRKPWLLQDVWVDLLLIENQLPFFILNDLFEMHKPYMLDCGRPASIANLVHHFFTARMCLKDTEGRLAEIDPSKIEHFVDFLRLLHLPSNMQARGRLERTTIPSITKLRGAGVKFEVGSSKNLFDLDFENGKLKIPKLTIGDETEILLRNFIAFEQCHCEDAYINDYVSLMNRLINTREDLSLVAEYEIVVNRCSNNQEGSFLINKLQDGVIFDTEEFYFASLCDKLNSYYRKPLHKWKADLKQKYFNTPWVGTSVVVAAILLILSLIQTVCSIISAMYAKPNAQQH